MPSRPTQTPDEPIPCWQFWIDVGGTFTDCVARTPSGELVRHKVLSSGVIKGAAAKRSNAANITDPLRQHDPADLWNGCDFRLLDDTGNTIAQAKVTQFDPQSATLHLDPPLSIVPADGQPYELHPGCDAPIVAIRYLLGIGFQSPIPPALVRLGTTRGTNALLTRTGARTAFITTRGFADILHIGYQNRPRLFDLAIKKPTPLFAETVEIDERLAANGTILAAPGRDQVISALTELKSLGVESLAICLLHAYQNPAHEQFVARVARELGFEEISVSSDVAPLIKLVARGDTTVVDAYLNPVLREYLQRLQAELPGSELRVLDSAGGLVPAARFFGKDSILSGPAGGVVGFARAAEAAGYRRAIGFDMGGTSTDVSRYDGRFELQYETEKAGVRIVSPMMAIETVAAGGGSICHFDGVRLRVGPQSAGADPGPACYGRGGPLAVTDLNLRLGRIRPEHFPFPLDRDAVDKRLQSLANEVEQATGTHYDLDELAEALLRITNMNMARAIRSVTIAKGADPRDYVVVAFGGAAAQHACAVARELGVQEILSHPDAGVLSAYGIGQADIVRHRAAGLCRPYDTALGEVETLFDTMTAELQNEILAEGADPARIEVRRMLDLRYTGLDAALTITEPQSIGKAPPDYAAAYEAEHLRRYGYVHADRRLEIVTARVEATARAELADTQSVPVEANRPKPFSQTTTRFEGHDHPTALYRRVDLTPGSQLAGPAIVLEANATTVVDLGWTAEMLSGGEILFTDKGPSESDPRSDQSSTTDPMMLEIFNNHFAEIADQMGVTLQQTASSTNIKERLDYSCAIFTAAGELVVNAPHIPVHLGAMGQTVRAILADTPDLAPDDIFVTNDPYRGGSHLPDITVVTPIHDSKTEKLLFFTASRAHHAELGGTVPGSMPPESQSLAEEGVLIRNFRLIRDGLEQTAALRDLLTGAPFPTRDVETNLADIAAQVAANRQGAELLRQLVARYSLPVVTAYMDHIRAAAESKMRSALARIDDGLYEFTDRLELSDNEQARIAVAITIDGKKATIDFTGTGAVLRGNLNATPAIVTAAVMYVFRCLIDEDIPLNEGVLAPLTLVLPECLLNPPVHEDPAQCAAVVGGNVETSQRIVDVLLGALGAAAASQGTMNNLLFGDDTFGYYETICGGAGATATADGADAVHTHMTNTRLTDPEVLEYRYPVRLWEFSIRRGSGGQGQHRGGDGIRRQLELLAPLEVSILSQRRDGNPPYGLAGGEPGAVGRNLLRRVGAEQQSLPPLVHFSAQPGDVITIETPGGGGFGKASNDDKARP